MFRITKKKKKKRKKERKKIINMITNFIISKNLRMVVFPLYLGHRSMRWFCFLLEVPQPMKT